MIKPIILAGLLLYVAPDMLLAQRAGNQLLSREFWSKQPSLSTVKALILQGADPAEQDLKQMDATTIAILSNVSLPVIDFLLAQDGNDINKPTHHYRTYLHWASSVGNIEVVKLLLSLGADINAKDEHGHTPLSYALNMGQGSVELLQLFAGEGYNLLERTPQGASLLMLSIATDRDGKLSKYLIGQGLSLEDKDNSGATLTDYALQGGNVSKAQELIAQGVSATPIALLRLASSRSRQAPSLIPYRYIIEELGHDPKILDEQGNTLIHLLAMRPKHIEVIRYLLDKGLDSKLKNKAGNIAFWNACGTQDLELIQLLRPYIDVNTSGQGGVTPLLRAIESSNSAIVAYLLAEGADVQAIDATGEGVLYRLSRSFNPKVSQDFISKLELLTKAGIPANSSFADGSNLYHEAATQDGISMLDAISQLGIDINAVNDAGLTPLHKAALTTHSIEILKRLIALGADKSIKTDLDETAYDLAQDNAYLSKQKVDLSFLK